MLSAGGVGDNQPLAGNEPPSPRAAAALIVQPTARPAGLPANSAWSDIRVADAADLVRRVLL